MTPSTTITSLTVLKNTSYVVAFIATLEFIGFSPQTLTLFVALMIMDILTGCMRVGFNQGGKHIKSRIGVLGVAKKFATLFMIFSVGITAKLIGYDTTELMNATITVLALSELYSILGNIHSLRTGEPKSEFDAVAFVLKKVGALLEKYFKKLFV